MFDEVQFPANVTASRLSKVVAEILKASTVNLLETYAFPLTVKTFELFSSTHTLVPTLKVCPGLVFMMPTF
jgi:hypothetical protein